MEEIKLDYQWLLKKVTETGGFTCTRDGQEPSAGYVVSRPEYEMRVSKKLMCEAILDQYFKLVADVPFVYVGCWYNTDDNLYYLDVNHVYNDKWVAIHDAIEFKQLAIWDIKAACEIRLPKVN